MSCYRSQLPQGPGSISVTFSNFTTVITLLFITLLFTSLYPTPGQVLPVACHDLNCTAIAAYNPSRKQSTRPTISHVCGVPNPMSCA
ncbi:uncharacterized protein M421DRAFT_186924 [Didymella exigua CBS 183.55]|uniref:Uncharacterized protein n=1 Tax=Didymella exigua CBS 183.55 TaxID=1150837 RepID=A0A6A5RIJ6_9PLEO|nr:uncharacterized protein M421DRAFT_186924 [Didymella exigua CBS 183.55]KAF1926918.1 hypothetical protein M421DRAFT_186924 [Didymella exigua CBS 183.55]